MANKIVLKKSSVAGRVPQLADLDWGEVALNYADGRLYFKRSTNVIDSFSTEGGSGGAPVETPIAYTTTTVSQEVIDSITASSYRSGKYEIQLTSPIGFERVELTFIHNNTSVFITTNGIRSDQPLGTFSAQVVNGNVEIVFTANHIDTTLVFTKKLFAPAGTQPNVLPEDLESGNNTIDLEEGTGEIDYGLLPENPSALPEDLESGTGSVDLETGSSSVDLNGGSQEVIPQDLESGVTVLDLETGSSSLDLSL